MTATAMQESVLRSLVDRPSRASAAAIGHRFVLNGAGPHLSARGVEALSKMVCDWSVAILDEAANDSRRPPFVRHLAVQKLRDLLDVAIDRGYAKITRREWRRLVLDAQAQLRARERGDHAGEIDAVAHLAAHVIEAVGDGFFGHLPDF